MSRFSTRIFLVDSENFAPSFNQLVTLSQTVSFYGRLDLHPLVKCLKAVNKLLFAKFDTNPDSKIMQALTPKALVSGQGLSPFLQSSRYPAFFHLAIGHNFYFVTDDDFDSKLPHFPGEIRQNWSLFFGYLHAESCIRERLSYRANDCSRLVIIIH